MKCDYCNEQATYTVRSLRKVVCDKHADQCARIGIVVQEIKWHVHKPIPQTDRAY